MSSIRKSFGWQTSQHLARGAVGMLIASIIARSYGERGLGILDSSFALINLLAGCAGLGMQRIITRDLCDDASLRPAIKGTGLALTAVACVLAAISVNLLSWNAPFEERFVILGGCLLLLVQPFGYLISSIFEANGRLDYVGKIQFAGLGVSTLARIICVWTNAPLGWLALAYSLDLAISASLGWLVARSVFKEWVSGWKFQWATAKALLKESLPLLLSSVAAFIYISVDMLMLKWMAGYEETGAYGAAIRISQIPLFLPGLLAGAYTSRLMSSYLDTGSFHKHDLSVLSRLLLALGGAVLLGGWTLGPFAVKILYGDTFARSGDILQIHVIGVFFMIVGSLRNHLLVLEGKGKLVLFCEVAGALTNVSLNFLLIPRYGAIGASWATVASYFLSFFLINTVHPGLRPYNRLLFSAFQRNPDSQNS